MNGNASINYNGQQIALKFGYPQAKEFAMALSENTDAYFQGENITPFGLAKLFHCAYKNSCLLKEVKPTITLEQFSDWLDENADKPEFQNEILDVVNVWTESRYTKLWAEEVKKKTAELIAQTNEIQKKNTKKSKQPSSPTE